MRLVKLDESRRSFILRSGSWCLRVWEPIHGSIVYKLGQGSVNERRLANAVPTPATRWGPPTEGGRMRRPRSGGTIHCDTIRSTPARLQSREGGRRTPLLLPPPPPPLKLLSAGRVGRVSGRPLAGGGAQCKARCCLGRSRDSAR